MKRANFDSSYGVVTAEPGCREINNVYGAIGFNGMLLQCLLEKIPEFKCIFRPFDTKLDWFWAAKFSFSNGNITVFFPWGSDRKSGQSVVLRAQNEVTIDQVRYIIKEIIGIFWWEYFSHSHHNPRGKMPKDVFGRIMPDGRRLVPNWYIDPRANIHPVLNEDGSVDMFLSHLEARRFFENAGWEIAS